MYVNGLKGVYAHVQYEAKNKANGYRVCESRLFSPIEKKLIETKKCKKDQYKTDTDFSVSSELWVIPKEGMFIIMNATTRADEKTGTRKEIKDIIKTIRFI